MQEREVRLLVTVYLDEDDTRTDQEVKEDLREELGGRFAPQIDLLDADGCIGTA